jgi:hypothetical protein
MKNFHVKIRYDGYFASFDVKAPADSIESIENSILDKLGRNEIKFEKDGFTHGKWITYEEVIDDPRPIHYETVLGTRVATRTPEVREA